jgi:CheY-like chemotaxis protein
MAENGLAGLRVLVVEDNPLIAFDLEDLLRQLRCNVLGPIGSIAAALRLLTHTRPDLALLNVDMGERLASPVAEALAGAAVPFAMVTGYDLGQIEAPVFAAAPCLAKPYTLIDLRRILQDLLAPLP